MLNYNRFFLFLFSIFSFLPLGFCDDFEGEDQVIIKASPYTYQETSDRFLNCAQKAGFQIVNTFHYSLENQTQPVASVFLFENADLTKRLLEENPLSTLFLPFKIIIWQNEKNQVWVAYTVAEILDAMDIIENEELLEEITEKIEQFTDDTTFAPLPIEELSSSN